MEEFPLLQNQKAQEAFAALPSRVQDIFRESYNYPDTLKRRLVDAAKGDEEVAMGWMKIGGECMNARFGSTKKIQVMTGLTRIQEQVNKAAQRRIAGPAPSKKKRS